MATAVAQAVVALVVPVPFGALPHRIFCGSSVRSEPGSGPERAGDVLTRRTTRGGGLWVRRDCQPIDRHRSPTWLTC